MPTLSHPRPSPHALRLDLVPDPVARTGTPLSRAASPAPSPGGGQQQQHQQPGPGHATHSHPHSPAPVGHHHHHHHPAAQLATQQAHQQVLHQPAPLPYPAHAHAAALAPTPTLLHASSSPAAASTTAGLPSVSRSTGPSPSPPTTPTPFSTSAAAASASASAALAHAADTGLLRGTADREGVHTAGNAGGAPDAVDGLEHAPGWVDRREVLAVRGETAVRAISADDLAELEQHHLSLDVPETTLFPWLHGMGDGNRLLDDFFASFPGYHAQFPAPRYRGLTVLRASGPADGPSSRPPSSAARPRPAKTASASAASTPESKGGARAWEDDEDGHGDGAGEGSGRRRGGSLASEQSSTGESETSWAFSEASSFPTSISSFASSVSTSSIASAAAAAAGKPSACAFQACEAPTGAPSTTTTAPAVVDASTGSVGLNPSPQAAFTPPPLASPSLGPSAGGTAALLTSAVPAEEILTLSAHPARRVGPTLPKIAGVPAGPPPAAADDRVTGEELAKPPLGRTGAVHGVFRRRDVGEGTISLRNLAVQGKKYATISDLVIYHPHGFCASALTVAERAAEAVDAVLDERRRALRSAAADDDGDDDDVPEPVRYNVFLVMEPFAAFEARHPQLVAVDGAGAVRHKTDLFAKERRENAELTRAREVSPGFFMGNSFDCPVLSGVGQQPLPGEDVLTGENQLGVDVCIEAFDDAEMPDPNRLQHASQYLASLSTPAGGALPSSQSAPALVRRDSLADKAASLALGSPDRAAFSLPASHTTAAGDDHGSSDSEDATMSDPSADEHDHGSAGHRAQPNQIYHLQCLSTSLVVQPGDWRALNALAGAVVEFVRWVKQTVDDGRRVLVHGYDGYTETSIFALAYVMHAHGLLLPEAYLHLHLDAGRSFFVYPHDLPLLRRIEDRLRTDARAVTAVAETAAAQQTRHSPAAATANGGGGGGGGQKWKNMLGGWKLGHYGGEGSSGSSQQQHQQPPQAPAGHRAELARRHERDARELERRRAHDAWFASACFEGSLPSRILDFIYLGNLNHASNPAMLHALGITHVVSVGESALLDPNAGGGGAPNSDLWFEHQAGRIAVLDMQSICDDGVSPLRPCIALAVEWIERARAGGGRVLVHCKVGVSRSATVTIAYLMKYCGYTLIDAYMLVRARRLNVLIQPNLKFMFELQGWEVELSREKAEAEHGVRMRRQANGEAVADGPRQHGTKAMSWPVMAKEMAILNHRYLGGSLD